MCVEKRKREREQEAPTESEWFVFCVCGIFSMQNVRRALFHSSVLASFHLRNYFLQVSKFASRGATADSIDLLKSNSSCHDSHTVGIAHTRWVCRVN